LLASNAGSATATKIASAISFTATSSRLTVALSREPIASSPGDRRAKSRSPAR
jgi:hypothetical protein